MKTTRIRTLVEMALDAIAKRVGYFIVPLDMPERIERMAKDGRYGIGDAVSDLKVPRGFYKKGQ